MGDTTKPSHTIGCICVHCRVSADTKPLEPKRDAACEYYVYFDGSVDPCNCHIRALAERDTTISELRAENEALRQMYCGDTDCNVRKEGNVDPAPLIDEAIRLRAEVDRLEKLRSDAVSAVTGEAKILLENAALRARVKEMEAAHETDLGRIVGLEGDLADTRARVAELEAERDAADTLSKLLTEQVNINAEDRDKARAEAAELRRLVKAFIDADEATYNTDSTAPSFGDLITDMQNKYAALRAHITTTDKETPTQAAITAEGEG
jgi:DNA repair exonuclease SbcCD ATPase subunit